MLSDAKPQAATTTNSATYTTGETSATVVTTTTSAPTTTSAIDNYVIGTIMTGKVHVPYNFRDQGVSGSISIGYALKFVTFEAVFLYNSLGIYREWDYDPYYFNGEPYNRDYRYSNFIGLGIRLGGMAPIFLNNKLTLAPHVNFEWAVPYLCRDVYYGINTVSPMVGANLFVRMSNNNRFFVGVEYEQKFFLDYTRLRLKNNTMGYINVNFGFVF